MASVATGNLPFLTGSIQGTGGTLRLRPEDFWVEEIPAYTASGEGEHVLCRLEKCELSTFDAVRILARELGVSPADIGTAGLKDKHAVTSQQVSLPPPTTPEQAMAIEHDGLAITSAAFHNNKLKTGHHRGNNFRIKISNLSVPRAEAAARAASVLEVLGSSPGALNWFGSQRFGRDGETAEMGRALVHEKSRKGPGGRKRRLFISAYQSQLFNEYLASRLDAGLYPLVLDGDLAKIRGHSKCFVASEQEQPRLDRLEIAVTGPMYGHRMQTPASSSRPAELEAAVLQRHGLEASSFRHLGKLALGTRRALSVVPEGATATATDDESVVVEFSLPPGSYATVIMREITKNTTNEEL